jgi:hypothetical protein
MRLLVAVSSVKRGGGRARLILISPLYHVAMGNGRQAVRCVYVWFLTKKTPISKKSTSSRFLLHTLHSDTFNEHCSTCLLNKQNDQNEHPIYQAFQDKDFMGTNEIGESAGIARVTFRVRCESLGYGEAVFLYPDDKSSPVSSCVPYFLTLDGTYY